MVDCGRLSVEGKRLLADQGKVQMLSPTSAFSRSFSLLSSAVPGSLRPAGRPLAPLRLTVAAIAALMAMALASSPASAVETGVVINSQNGFSPESHSQLAGLGVGWIRGFVPWRMFEPNRGHLNEPEIVSLEAGLAALPPGTKVILDVVNSPQWASGSTNPAMPPRDPADFGRFVGAMAKRLAGKVAAWEIWNEEDDSLWWASGPEPAAYASLLEAAYPAIKAADPSAKVVLGGLTGNNYEFLAQLYAHGAKGSFDAVGVHTDLICNTVSPYDILRNGRTDQRINRWAFLGYRTVHEVMLANGDDKPIWMTELGWSTSTQECEFGAGAGRGPAGVSPQTQATFLAQAYHCLGEDPYVQVGIWFGVQDTEPFNGARSSYGLLTSNLHPKPAYGALADFDHNGDRLTGACGSGQGPSVKLTSPKTNVRYTNTLPITVSASDSVGVYQISLYDDQHIIRSFYVHGGTTTLEGHMIWYGARLLKPGKHTLMAKAFDERNNTSTTSITIIRGAQHKKPKRRPHRKH
jgi:hypothetical protein